MFMWRWVHWDVSEQRWSAGVEQRDVAVAVNLIQRMKARELDADISLNLDQPASPRCASCLHLPACTPAPGPWSMQA